VESEEAVKAQEAEKALKAKAEVKKVKKEVVMLVSAKRAQNAGIALARIKVPFEDLKVKISNMQDEGLTTDQLLSLEEFMPTPEEADQVRNYKGDTV
jgi:hypothetical protein